MIRILIVDDHAVVRAGVRQILEEDPEMVVAGEVGSGQDALARVRDERWDVVVLDLSLPDRSGMDVLQHLKSYAPDLPVLILTMQAEDQYASRLIRMGAAGFLSKESAPEALIIAVRTVAQGGRYISPSLAMTLALGGARAEERHATLSKREFQVVCLLATGRTPTAIAHHLEVSIKTVSTHRSRALEKMRLKSTAELIHYALQHRLVLPFPEG